VAEVDRYREAKVREGRLSAGEINKTLVRLGQILDVAEERELIGRNPMRVNPRRRKLKAPKPRAIWLDRAEQITALLDAAAELDVDARGDRRHVPRRVIVECFVFAGLRIEELCELRWRDVDLAAGRLNVANSKTDAGRRHVQLLAPVREGLATHKASGSTPGGHVFATRDGGQPSKNNVRARVFNAAVKRANANLERDGLTPLPEGLTPHKLRHTFASLLMATGQDPVHVMGQLGHTDPAFSLRVYGPAMSQDAGEKERLRALVDGSDWADTGKIPSSTSEAATAAAALVGQETAHLQGER
jgi:integrase